MIALKDIPGGLTFSVHVQPRASKCAILGMYQDALKIKLTAPPAGGAANRQCIEILARALGLPKSSLDIIGGQTHRLKQIKISCADRETADALKAGIQALAAGVSP